MALCMNASHCIGRSNDVCTLAIALITFSLQFTSKKWITPVFIFAAEMTHIRAFDVELTNSIFALMRYSFWWQFLWRFWWKARKERFGLEILKSSTGDMSKAWKMKKSRKRKKKSKMEKKSRKWKKKSKKFGWNWKKSKNAQKSKNKSKKANKLEKKSERCWKTSTTPKSF